MCVILGAGTSFDVHNEGVTKLNPAFQPTLASELFNVYAKPQYEAFMLEYPKAYTLSALLGPQIAETMKA